MSDVNRLLHENRVAVDKIDMSDVKAIIALQDELNRLALDGSAEEEEGLQADSKIEDATGTYTLVNKVYLW